MPSQIPETTHMGRLAGSENALYSNINLDRNNKDVTPPHELSNVVYVFTCHCINKYLGRTFQRFYDSSFSQCP